MVYINKLQDLNPKTAEVDSVPIVREFKRDAPLPLTVEKLQKYVSNLFRTEDEKNTMLKSLEMIEHTFNMVKELYSQNNPLIEAINLERAMSILKELKEPLSNNINYAEEIFIWNDQIISDFIDTINSLSRLKTNEEKTAANKRLSDIFKMLLRNDNMFYNEQGIVGEARLEHIKSLGESMERGFFLHLNIEDELKKTNFRVIKSRLEQKDSLIIDEIEKNINDIKKGIETAYNHNMRMIKLALIFYSYIRISRER